MTYEQLRRRQKQLSDINSWIKKEGYQVITHSQNNPEVLGLYKPAATKNDIPEFLKDLVSGDNKTLNTFIEGMHAALNLCS